MARIFTWTGRGGDGGGTAWLQKQFESSYIFTGTPEMANVPEMGGNCLEMPMGGCGLRLASGTLSDIYIGMRVKPKGWGDGSRLLAFQVGTTPMATVRRYGYSTGPPFPCFYGYRGDDATLLGGGAIPAAWDGVYYVEVYYKPDPTSGRLVIKINGRIDCDYTGQTVAASQTTFDELWLGGGYGNDYVGWYINDIVVDNANWPGMCNMAVLAPDGVGNANQWSPSAGANWECVDEKIPSPTDYNHINSAAQVDSFAVEALPAAAVAVKSVNVHVFPVKEGTPTPTQVAPLLRTGSTDYEGSGGVAGIYMKDIKTIWEENPNTTDPWAVSEVNAMEMGYKSAT
jgi:hypothetical protein